MTPVADALDLARAFLDAVNRADASAVAAFYDPRCIVEHLVAGDDGVHEGRDAARAIWAAEFARWAGALPGGHRLEVSRVAGIETGWGWARAEWVEARREITTGVEQWRAGYSHFWVEGGLIRRHRSVGRAITAVEAKKPAPASDRQYPTRPLVGVGAVVLMDDGQIVLVKRRHEPLAGQWSLPGGMLELGETLQAGAAREIREETGLVVDVGAVVEVFDRILVDDTGRVRYHFVLIDYLCRPRGGTLAAGSDVAAVALANPRALGPYRITEKAQAVVAHALAAAERGPS